MTIPAPLRGVGLPDPVPCPAAVRPQRSSGRAEVTLAPDGRPLRLFQQGSAKAILLAGPRPEITYLNTSGGLAGGDRLALTLELPAGGVATATTQTAERAYRATDEAAQVDVRLRLGPGAHLDWLPQETILFNRSRLNRRTRVDLAPGAGCLLAETVILGRAAMGEAVEELEFRDRREVWRCGRPLWVDPLHLTGPALAGPATLAGARAFATLALIRDGAGDLLAPLRAALDEAGCWGAASALPGRLMVRLMAPAALPLRRQLIRAQAVLRPGLPLPRVWQA
ncbi:MAG: urease accessory protein UreD [Paracoccaceae bacterium]